MNELIIRNLELVKRDIDNSDVKTDRFRKRAYEKAIGAIKDLEIEIRSIEDVRGIEGIGQKIMKKIGEILETGKLHQVEDIDKDSQNKSKIIEEFKKIWGVGPTKAKQLYNLGARSIKDVKEKYVNNLNAKQKIGLKYYEDLNRRLPRSEVEKLMIILKKEIGKWAKLMKCKTKLEFCGSFRRNKDTCGDMDVLLCVEKSKNNLKNLVEYLRAKNILADTLGLGKTKYMGIIKTSEGMAFRIDMEMIEEEEWVYALLYFTGSGNFNAKQRSIAKEQGYSLSEHGLRDIKTDEYVKGLKTEKDIFEFLGMVYIKPCDRK